MDNTSTESYFRDPIDDLYACSLGDTNSIDDISTGKTIGQAAAQSTIQNLFDKENPPLISDEIKSADKPEILNGENFAAAYGLPLDNRLILGPERAREELQVKFDPFYNDSDGLIFLSPLLSETGLTPNSDSSFGVLKFIEMRLKNVGTKKADVLGRDVYVRDGKKLVVREDPEYTKEVLQKCKENKTAPDTVLDSMYVRVVELRDKQENVLGAIGIAAKHKSFPVDVDPPGALLLAPAFAARPYKALPLDLHWIKEFPPPSRK